MQIQIYFSKIICLVMHEQSIQQKNFKHDPYTTSSSSARPK